MVWDAKESALLPINLKEITYHPITETGFTVGHSCAERATLPNLLSSTSFTINLLFIRGLNGLQDVRVV